MIKSRQHQAGNKRLWKTANSECRLFVYIRNCVTLFMRSFQMLYDLAEKFFRIWQASYSVTHLQPHTTRPPLPQTGGSYISPRQNLHRELRPKHRPRCRVSFLPSRRHLPKHAPSMKVKLARRVFFTLIDVRVRHYGRQTVKTCDFPIFSPHTVLINPSHDPYKVLKCMLAMRL